MPSPDLTILSRAPLVAGVPLTALETKLTPTELFFIRNHFPTPAQDAQNWRLSVDGTVEKPLNLSYTDLKQFPARELNVLLECAGNSRFGVQPPIEGLLWDHGGVSTASWTGVPLRAVLEHAGLKTTAREVLFEGADRGKEFRGPDKELGYAMSLPLDKALHPDTLLAYQMNGEGLTPEHGYPVRLVAPGWYGMTSVKWLTHVQVLDYSFQGYHQSSYYVFIREGQDPSSPKERVTSMRVKSLITWPGRGQVLPTGCHLVRGVAWSGQGPISHVEVSTRSGRRWHSATLQKSDSPYAWQRWEFQWEATRPGYFLIRARATDEKGSTQPTRGQWNFRGFANNSIHAVPVEVRS